MIRSLNNEKCVRNSINYILSKDAYLKHYAKKKCQDHQFFIKSIAFIIFIYISWEFSL